VTFLLFCGNSIIGKGVLKMQKTTIVFIILISLFASGCAGVPKQDNAAGNSTEKEKQDQAVVVNVADTLLGAGIGLVAGVLCGTLITMGTDIIMGTDTSWWFRSLDGRFYIPSYAGAVAGGVTGWLLSPKYEAQKNIP
jgi:hypothetical protein